MKQNAKLGGILAIVGALMGIVGHYVLFMNWYERGMAAEAAEPGCEILLKWLHPIVTDMGMLAGVLFAVSAYGFFTARKWVFPLSVIVIVLAMQGSWFINVPYMAAGLPPVYFTLFWPYLLMYFLLVRLVGGVPWNRTVVGLLGGMAFVFCFMNGIASTSRIITVGAPIFTMVQRLHWIAMVGWGVVTVGLILRPREWMRVVGLSAGTLELVVGIPLAIVTAQELGRFSLFALAPITCLVLVVLFVWPGVWERLASIVICGAAGAMPVMAGRALGLGSVDWIGAILGLAVLFWIPTHMLTYSMRYFDDYRAAGVPTFPSTYGFRITRDVIAVSSVLAGVCMVLAAIGIGLSYGYLCFLAVSSGGLLLLALLTKLRPSDRVNFGLFKYASLYMLSAMLLVVLDVL